MGTHEGFMQRAIDIARTEMMENGAAPYAAVIVKNGKIVGEGVNLVVNNSDPTSHGEVEAIRDAGKNLGTWDLSGCVLYTTCEPCEMCVAAIYWARIRDMYYACSLADATAIGFDLKPLTTLVRKDLHERDLPARQILAQDGRAVLALWAEQPGFETF